MLTKKQCYDAIVNRLSLKQLIKLQRITKADKYGSRQYNDLFHSVFKVTKSKDLIDWAKTGLDAPISLASDYSGDGQPANQS